MNVGVRPTAHSVSHTLSIQAWTDVIRARQLGADLASSLGFGTVDQTRIATAISEITRNVIEHSGTTGEMWIGDITKDRLTGVLIVVEDAGCGIADIAAAMQRRSSTSVASLGAGLPGSQRIMDEFGIESAPGKGTVVRMIKWLLAEAR